MLLKYFYDSKLAQASYMVACQACGVAIVIDPARDITPYLQAAKAEGVQITHVTETHIHADYVSGSRELARATGAGLYLSAMGDDVWQYEFVGDRVTHLRDGDTFMVGNVCVEVLHTPGHTPEHISFQITDTAGADKPIGIFTGDFIFVGTVGRPDLLEEAAGIMDTKEPGARQQYANIQRFKQLPDYLQIWPGHGAGSACGKGLGSIPSTTLGYEKLFNPAFQFDDEAAFVSWLLDSQPEAPYYFAQMKRVNREGPALLGDLPQPKALTQEQMQAHIDSGALVIDARRERQFATGHLPGTMGIPGNSDQFSTYVGWYVDYAQPTYLIASQNDIARLVTELRAIGVDDIPGYLPAEQLQDTVGKVTQMTARDIFEQKLPVLDVRGADEYAEQHIPNAHHIPMGYIPQYLNDIPRDYPLAVQCGGGTRSQVVISLLQKHGFTNLINLKGGIDAWQRDGLPLEREE